MTESTTEHKGPGPWMAPIRLDEVPEGGRHVNLRADARMLAQLAAFTEVRSVERAEASLDVSRRGRDGLRVVGEVRAKVCQTCVVTLEPMESEIVEAVDVVFKPVTEAKEKSAVAELVDEADPPEPLVNGTVDLGALATEFLILGIDPYPRKPDAVFEAPAPEGPEDGPFAALAKLKSDGGPDK